MGRSVRANPDPGPPRRRGGDSGRRRAFLAAAALGFWSLVPAAGPAAAGDDGGWRPTSAIAAGAEPLPRGVDIRGPSVSLTSAEEICPLPAVGPCSPVVLDETYVGGGWFPDHRCPPGYGSGDCCDDLWAPRPWSWQILPANVMWSSYLAGPKEPRFATVWYDDVSPDPIVPTQQEGWLWDSTLGGRVAILRYGSDASIHPQGFEVQIEGAAFVRLDPAEDRDLRSSDYRFGIPLIYAVGRWQTKLAYYHLSAHLGDEAMIRHPTFPRVNYVRDVFVWGNSYYPLDWMRIYGEVGWSFYNAGGSEPWEFQFGTELVQPRPTGIHGSPFLAVNGMSRQELDWGGNVCVQAGWAWRGDRGGKLFRLGFEYLYGSDPQYEFVFNNQNRAGIGMWYDF